MVIKKMKPTIPLTAVTISEEIFRDATAPKKSAKP
jgi:hypothetical protein